MLRFEHFRDGIFEVKRQRLDGQILGWIHARSSGWRFEGYSNRSAELVADELDQIAAKLRELNGGNGDAK